MGYIPHTAADQRKMLDALGLDSVDQLFDSLPPEVRLNRPLDLPQGKTEMETLDAMEAMAGRNTRFATIFRGAGSYNRYIPSVVGSIVSRSEFYTAYTPYQPETSQGILQAIFEYQTMICELTGMDASNASVYDGATSAYEAIAMCVDGRRRRAVLSAACHPQTIEVVRTWCAAAGVELALCPLKDGHTDMEQLAALCDAATACVLVQQPNFLGLLEDVAAVEQAAHGAGAKLILSCEPVSLGALRTPGEWGADIAIGDGQGLGNPMNFGGPGLGFMTCREAMQRKLPGRIVGETVDHEGHRGYVLTLQAREQHIRREKASSNICSNQALNALAAAVYMSAMGPEGLAEAANLSCQRAHEVAAAIAALPGFRLKHSGPFFQEFVIESDVPPERIEAALVAKNILPGLPLEHVLGKDYANCTLWCATERTTQADIAKLVSALKEVAQ